MELKQKQFVFASLLPSLITEAIRLGFQCTLGECYRTPEQAALNAKNGSGIANSLHTLKLAIDINLFKDGVWLKDNEAHRILGTWWEMQSAGKDFTCNWGGHWGDGNHYSIGHGGRK